ncbi:tryptophan-rich sensory protein [Paenibacillus barcinonensis]|uniref:tryptophan-rich sensory protein n=1 Tax=Paenibacillus barcinonensis TaxID=198119 RepID=UPI001C124192|nr:tryptophan-rich sensory protein [Paenibacillus barcinonensis]MBU5356013.1 tryptophan-rich sensory protein [Paenibacillus barcinonensis]
MSRNNPYKWLNALGFIAVIIVNYLSNALPIGGRTNKEVSDMYPVLLTPSGYAFAIWGLIYLLLAGFVIYQFVPASWKNDSITRLGYWFLISCVFNVAWIFAFQNLHIGLALIIIILLLLSLIVLYVRTREITMPTTAEIWLVKLLFSIYLGWVSVATIVNAAVFLYKIGWNGFGISETAWTIIMLIVGSVLAVLVSFQYRDSVYPLVFSWAYIAIALKQKDVTSVYYTGIILAIVLAVYAVWLFFARNQDRD